MLCSETRCCWVSFSSHLPFGQVLVLSQNFYWLKPSVSYVRYFTWHFCSVLFFLLPVPGFKQKSFLLMPTFSNPWLLLFKVPPLTSLFVKDYPIVVSHSLLFLNPPFSLLCLLSISPISAFENHLYWAFFTSLSLWAIVIWRLHPNGCHLLSPWNTKTWK